MTILLTAWGFLKRMFDALMAIPIPLLLCIVACAALSLPPTYKWAVTSGKLHKAEQQIERISDKLANTEASLKSCTATRKNLTDALEVQNAAVLQLQAESDAATKRANDAIRKARAQRAVYERKIAKLQAARPSGDVCVAARSLIVETLSEDRR